MLQLRKPEEKVKQLAQVIGSCLVADPDWNLGSLVPCPECFFSPLHNRYSLVVKYRLLHSISGFDPISISCHRYDLRQVTSHFHTLNYPMANKGTSIHHVGLLGKLNLITYVKCLVPGKELISVSY